MSASRWANWGASMVGSEHLRLGQPNQDAWAVRRFGSGVAVAVSDGLGSCQHADIGSRAACRAVMAAAKFHFRHSPDSFLTLPVLTRLLWSMLLSGHSQEDCSATCLMVIAKGSAGSFLAQLGDGLIAACRPDGTVDLLMPDKSDGFSNLTVGLASNRAASQWRTILVPDDRYCAFVLCTDGIADDLEIESTKAFAWEVYSHYKEMPNPRRRREVRHWLSHWPVPGQTDDKTIVCLYRNGGTHGL